VAEVDWTVHIPRLIDYWARVLLRQPGYDGYILGPHQRVHALERFEAEHFDRWYRLWVETIDASWSGPRAEMAKEHAAKTANMLARRLSGGVDWVAPTGALTPNA
jgi:hemoglobin